MLTIVIPALLTFLAAVLASALAYRQWKKQHAFERSKTFISDKSAAYKELWTRVEAVDIRLRTYELRDEEFTRDLRELNSYILLSEVYFDEGLQLRVMSYLRAARRVSKLMMNFPKRGSHITEELTEDEAEVFQEIREAVFEAQDAREAIRLEVRKNLEG